jgi:P4 family phage/plasmid primase-like protien
MDVSDWIAALGFSADEYVAVCHKHNTTGDFKYSVLPPAAVPSYVDLMSAAHDVWLGVNPVAGPARSTGGRGKPEDVTRMSAVFADLDVKPGGCADFDVAQAVVDEVSSVIGEYPTMVVFSGHGLQPYWAIDTDDGEITPDGHGALSTTEMEAVLLRFGRLVRAVAAAHGAKVDSVYDLARILRCPGTRNFKDDVPADTSAAAGVGAPMALDTLAEKLDEAGIFDSPSADTDANESSDPAGWDYVDKPCGYATAMARQWMTEDVDGRHPWALRCMVRLECARRNGCLSRELYQGISEMVQQRFLNLLATQQPSRKPHRYEWRDICSEAERIASVKTPAGLASELGAHPHETLIDAAVKAGNVRQLPTGRNTAKSPTGGDTGPGIATVTQLPSADAKPEPKRDYTLTDDGNAQRMVAQWADRLRYVPEQRCWVRWDGAQWKRHADDSPALQAARDIARTLPVIAGDKTAVAHKNKTLSKNGVLAMIRLAQGDANLQVPLELLDTHGYELNTPNGAVDLRTGQLLPHDAAKWHTKIAGAPYDPAADAPRWAAFLDTTFKGNAELIRYMQRLIGYAAIGDVFHHVLPFLFGAGNNGKSVLLDVVRRTLGEYATSAPLNFLLAGTSERHLAEIANLAGARFVTCSEVNQDSKFDEAKIKMLTGGDMVSARFMRQDLFTFKPTHTLFLMGNHQPRVGAGGHSFWRRLRLIPFDHQVQEGELIEHLDQVLFETEGSGILNWIVQGAVSIINEKSSEPNIVLAATEDYAESEDEIGQFIADCIVIDPDAPPCDSAEVYDTYTTWCNQQRARPKNNRIFGKELSIRLKPQGVVFGKRADGRIRVLRGIQIEKPYTTNLFDTAHYEH